MPLLHPMVQLQICVPRAHYVRYHRVIDTNCIQTSTQQHIEKYTKINLFCTNLTIKHHFHSTKYVCPNWQILLLHKQFSFKNNEANFTVHIRPFVFIFIVQKLYAILMTSAFLTYLYTYIKIYKLFYVYLF